MVIVKGGGGGGGAIGIVSLELYHWNCITVTIEAHSKFGSELGPGPLASPLTTVLF